MPYIGKTGFEVFSGTSKDIFDGDNSTVAFTMSKTVLLDTDIEVFVENVQQEPGSGKAYTVSGTTLTFSTAPPTGTGNVYVIHRNSLSKSVLPPADLGSRNYSISGTLTANGGAVFNENSADKDFRVESNGESHMLFVDGGNDAVILGHTVKVDGINDDNEGVKGSGGHLQLHGATPCIDFFSYRDANATHGGINFMKSRNNTVGSTSIITNGDVIGSIAFGGFDGNDYASIMGKIDFQAGGDGMGQDDTAGEMVFYTSADGTGGNGSSERMRISSTGFLNLQASNASGTALKSTNSTSTSPFGMQFDFSNAAPNNTDNYFIAGEDSSANRFKIFSSGTIQNATGTYGSLSDERLKTDITDANSQWDDIKNIKVRNFKKFDNTFTQLGVIAQEVEKVSPNLVFESTPEKGEIKHSSVFGTLYTQSDEDNNKIPDGKKVGDVKEVKEKTKGIKYSVLYMKAVKALQEAMTRIETLETSNADLIKRIEVLEAK